jgi:hypothetical protein
MLTKVSFFREVHNKIETNKNIKRVQDKQQNTKNKRSKKDFEMEFDLQRVII